MNEADIRKKLATRALGRELIVLDAVESTNAYARTIASGPFIHGTLVITDRQTAGRGRMGRVWRSSPGNDLTFSLILRPFMAPERLGLLSLATGLAITEAIRSFSALPALCKWPNDVLIGGKKCSGVLAESVLENANVRAVVVGIGINVNQPDFGEELNATSLAIAGGRHYDRYGVLNAVLVHLERRFEQLERPDTAGMLHDWRTLNC